MKKFIITILITFHVEGDYLNHSKSQALIDELVLDHGFEQSFIEEVYQMLLDNKK